jgi:hypothetical protein
MQNPRIGAIKDEGGRMKDERGQRFKPYPGYKDSDVEWLGEVPEHWEVKRMHSSALINPSRSELA